MPQRVSIVVTHILLLLVSAFALAPHAGHAVRRAQRPTGAVAVLACQEEPPPPQAPGTIRRGGSSPFSVLADVAITGWSLLFLPLILFAGLSLAAANSPTGAVHVGHRDVLATLQSLDGRPQRPSAMARSR